MSSLPPAGVSAVRRPLSQVAIVRGDALPAVLYAVTLVTVLPLAEVAAVQR